MNIHAYIFVGLMSDLEIILTTICRAAEQDIDRIKSRSRKTEYILVRQVYSYIARKLTGRSFREIGELVGVSHSNTLQAVRKVENYINANDYLVVNLLKKVESMNFNTKKNIRT